MAVSFMTNLIKKAYVTNMSYDITDSEKMQAERAIVFFNHTLKLLDQASNYLDIMKTPFKDNQDMTPDEVMKARAAIRRFRDKAIENFNIFKVGAFKCVNIMQNFSSDTQTIKIMKAFISAIDDLEYNVNKFANLFSDLEDKDFSNNIVKSIENIQKQCQDIDEMIEDRVKNNIQSNILAKNWVDSVSDEMQMKIEKKTPLILDLYNKRQDQLNETIKERTQLGE
jgi:hypothetical protein